MTASEKKVPRAAPPESTHREVLGGGSTKPEGDNIPPRPQYLHIAGVLQDRILKGTYKANDALPTFNALAEEFGVSLVTVNRAIQELDTHGCIVRYRGKGVYAAPNQPANGNNPAADKPIRTIGFVIPDLANPFYASMAKSIQSILNTQKFSVITHSTDGEHKRWDQYLRRLLEDRVDGVILVPLDTSRSERERVLWELKVADIPFVYLNTNYERVPSDFVIVDTNHGAQEVAKYLIGLGHRRLACISAEPCVNLTRRKLQTFRDTAALSGINMMDADFVISPLAHDEGGKAAALELLRREANERPTAIFATNDIIAFGVLAAAHQLGLRVPSDISVIGFDNIEAARFMTPPMTTVTQPIEEMAAQAAKILLQRIDGTLDRDFQQRVFLPTVVERASCSPPTPGTVTSKSHQPT